MDAKGTSEDKNSSSTDENAPDVADNFYYWRDIFPELEILEENIEVILSESENIEKVLDNYLFKIHYHLFLLLSLNFFILNLSIVGSMARRSFFFMQR